MTLGLQMESKYIKVATTDPTTGQRREPNVLTNPTRNAEFLATQLQSAGYFQLDDDEALVVTINPGNAGYFVVPVTNDWTITDNYWDQQTSLNIAQAKKNPDGTYTIVISPSDPDVWNWVSTGGLNQGTISIRFQDLDMNSTTLPTISSQVVSLDGLANVLPPGTVYATTQDRLNQIALRKSGFNNRFAPLPAAIAPISEPLDGFRPRATAGRTPGSVSAPDEGPPSRPPRLGPTAPRVATAPPRSRS
jgi:hypothetical protein